LNPSFNSHALNSALCEARCYGIKVNGFLHCVHVAMRKGMVFKAAQMLRAISEALQELQATIHAARKHLHLLRKVGLRYPKRLTRNPLRLVRFKDGWEYEPRTLYDRTLMWLMDNAPRLVW